MNEIQKSQFLIYRSEDGRIKLDVRFQNDTVWLTQAMIAELFQTTVPNVSMHIKSVYEDGELVRAATVKKFLSEELDVDLTAFSNSTIDSPLMVDINLIKPSKFQPRKEFDEEALKSLAQSIKDKGVLFILVAPN